MAGFEGIQNDELPRASLHLDYLGNGRATTLQFRRFLHMITQIGMDLVSADVDSARQLAADYRLRVSPTHGHTSNEPSQTLPSFST